jgi:hypothetical protein
MAEDGSSSFLQKPAIGLSPELDFSSPHAIFCSCMTQSHLHHVVHFPQVSWLNFYVYISPLPLLLYVPSLHQTVISGL